MVDYKVQSLQMKPSNQYDTMFKLVEVFELDDNWRKMSLAHREESNAQHLYSQIHQDCHLYKTLYR